jgi:hypothetical protein
MNMESLLLGSNLRLRPVIELEPASYAEVAAPPEPGPWTPALGDAYWRAAMRAANLDVEPVRPGSWFVYADQLTGAEQLRTILRVNLSGDEHPASLEEVAPLPGGYALLNDDSLLLLPNCCGDLGDIREWSDAAAYREAEPRMVWIGHPWLSAWFDAGTLVIREEREYHQPAAPKVLRIRPDALLAAVNRAAVEVDDLVGRLVEQLRAGAVPGLDLDAAAVGSILVGREA